VVFGLFGPSDVCVRNVALGSLSPTLMGMVSSRAVFWFYSPRKLAQPAD
jgi:hypothetical protein